MNEGVYHVYRNRMVRVCVLATHFCAIARSKRFPVVNPRANAALWSAFARDGGKAHKNAALDDRQNDSYHTYNSTSTDELHLLATLFPFLVVLPFPFSFQGPVAFRTIASE